MAKEAEAVNLRRDVAKLQAEVARLTAAARKEKMSSAFRAGVLSTMIENKKKEVEDREGMPDAAAYVAYFADLPEAEQRANLRGAPQ